MTTAFHLLQSLLFFSLGLSVAFLYYCLRYRHRRGVTSLVVMFTGVVIWILSELVQMQLRDPSFAGFGMALRILGVEITVIGMLFLGLEYTGREQYLTWKLAALFSVVPLIEVGLSLSPWRGVFFEAHAAEASPWGYEVGMTLLFGAHIVYSYLFIVAGIGLLLGMMVRANAGYRRQLLAVLVALLIPVSVNVLFHFGVLALDLTPVSFLATSVVLMFATFKLQLLDAIPVARQTVLEEMEDMVVVLDENHTIITTNTAVETRFQEGSLTGESATRLFGESGLEQVETDGQHELTVTIDGEKRSINVNSSPITDHSGNLLARVLVCRDVTAQKRREAELRRREEELELLKDLQSRFLRHNLRNELNVIRANAQLLADMDDPKQREAYETVIEKTDQILDWSKKARTIEQLVETDQVVTRNVVAEIETLLADLKEEYPDVTFELDTEPEANIAAVPQVDRALRNVLDNAARYNTADNPRVEVTIEQSDDSVVMTVCDNGPGLESYEIETLEDRAETQLQHGTGLGLWLVYWVIDKSDGSLSFDVDDGTTVILTFNRGGAEYENQPTVTLAPDGGGE